MSYFDTNRGRERYLGARARALGVPATLGTPGYGLLVALAVAPLAAWLPGPLGHTYQVP